MSSPSNNWTPHYFRFGPSQSLTLEQLQLQNKKLRDVLWFYADEVNWTCPFNGVDYYHYCSSAIENDRGQKARGVLNE